MKNIGLISVVLFTAFTLFSCQKESLPIDNPEDDFILKGNLLVNSNPSLLAARVRYIDEIVHCGFGGFRAPETYGCFSGNRPDKELCF